MFFRVVTWSRMTNPSGFIFLSPCSAATTLKERIRKIGILGSVGAVRHLCHSWRRWRYLRLGKKSHDKISDQWKVFPLWRSNLHDANSRSRDCETHDVGFGLMITWFFWYKHFSVPDLGKTPARFPLDTDSTSPCVILGECFTNKQWLIVYSN